MAYTSSNQLLGKIRGSIGKQVVFRQRGDKTVMSAPPRRKKRQKPTPRQAVVRNRYRIALVYARKANREPEMKAAYKAVAAPGQTCFNMAIRDCILPPVIEWIYTELYDGSAGSLIEVRATDDFRVKSVKVEIRLNSGRTIEKGEARLHRNGRDWLYETTATNSDLNETEIIATARDHPGNETSLLVKVQS